MTPLASQLKWLIGIRLVVITSIGLPYFLLQLTSQVATPHFGFLYPLAALTYLASLVYLGLFKLLPGRLTLQAYVQFVGDLLLISALVYASGGLSSPFSILYLVVIIVASTLLRRRAGLTIAEIAWILYAAVLVGLYFGWLPDPTAAPREVASEWRLIYLLAVHLLAFYVVALLTSYLAQNVTRAEQELELKSENLADLEVIHRDVIQSISSGLIATDLDGMITSVNRAGTQILGKGEPALIGNPVYESGLFAKDQWEKFATASHAKGKLRDEVECWRRNERIYVGFSISDLADGEGHRRGFILIFQDLTDWRKLQDEVQLKDRMAAVGELAAGIAHEIGNPLAAISGSVQMLSATNPENTSQNRLLEIILQESRRLDRIIKGFLQFASPKERSSVQFDVAKQLKENIALLRNSEEVADHHRLEVELTPSSALLVADPDQISQIFWNLARNALRAMPDGGTLKVVGTLENGNYRIQFIDSGKGMSETERANVFHPFQSFFDGGSGIGMAIVYRIVEEHGGRILVDSGQGKGTTVTVELPVAKTGAVKVPVGT